MKRIVLVTVSSALAAAAVVLLVQPAESQPRISTTRQIQVIGAAATSQSHGAWIVDLQASTVIFCERVAAGVQCHTTAIP
jgi:hypothetical protein